jgi:RNA polymerase sigma factor (sigma-70 family)
MMDQRASVSDLEALYERELSRFRRVAAVVAGSADEGSEAVQEAFAQALVKRGQYRPERGPLEAWVWKIVLNEAANTARRKRRAKSGLWSSVSSIEGGGAGSHPPSTAEEAEALALLAQLPERERLTLFLRYVADLDYVEIAEILGVRTGTVGAALSSGRGRLRRLLKEGSAR